MGARVMPIVAMKFRIEYAIYKLVRAPFCQVSSDVGVEERLNYFFAMRVTFVY